VEEVGESYEGEDEEGTGVGRDEEKGEPAGGGLACLFAFLLAMCTWMMQGGRERKRGGASRGRGDR
jgi:hypothetical protein